MARSAAYLEMCHELGLEDLHDVTISWQNTGLHVTVSISRPDKEPIIITDFDQMDRIAKLARSISNNDFPTAEDIAEEALWSQ